MNLYTKEGHPLQVFSEIVYSRSGKVVGRLSGRKVFGKDGRYVGTIDGDRLVYRSIDSSEISSSFSASDSIGIATAKSVSSAIWGDEPTIPD